MQIFCHVKAKNFCQWLSVAPRNIVSIFILQFQKTLLLNNKQKTILKEKAYESIAIFIQPSYEKQPICEVGDFFLDFKYQYSILFEFLPTLEKSRF